MPTEEQAHIQWLKDKAQSLGLTFDQYMLFLIFETLNHASVLQTGPLTRAPWENEEQQTTESDGEGNL